MQTENQLKPSRFYPPLSVDVTCPHGNVFPNSVSQFVIGDRVSIQDRGSGSIVYLGKLEQKQGDWAGVVLDKPEGKHSGTVNGVQYFQCPDKHGIFVKTSALEFDNSSPPVRLSDCKRNSIQSDSGSHLNSPRHSLHSEKRESSPSGRRFLFAENHIKSVDQADSQRRGHHFSSSYHNNRSPVSPASNKDYSAVSKSTKAHEHSMTSSSNSASNRWVWKRGNSDNFSLDIDLANDFNSQTHGDVMLKEIIREKESYIQQLISERNSKMIEKGLISSQEEANLQEEFVYTAQIKELNKKILQLEKENAKLKLLYDEEQKRVEDLTFEVEETHIDNSALKDANEKCESRFQDVSQNLKLEKARCQELTKKLSNLNGRFAAETLRAKEAEQSTRLYINQVEALQTRKKQLQEHVKQFSQEFNETNFKEILKMKDQDVAENKNRLQTLEEKLKFAKDKIGQLEDSLDNWPDENQAQIQKIESLQKDCSRLEDRNSQLVKACSLKTSELSNLEANRDSLKQKQEHLLANKENFEKTLLELGDDIKSVNQIEKLKQQLIEKEEEIVSLRQQLTSSRAEHNQQKDSLNDDLFSKLEALEMAKEKYNSKILPQKQQLDVLSKELARWQNRCSQLDARHKKDLQNLQNLHAVELNRLTTVLNRLNQDYNEKGKKLDSVLDLLDLALETQRDLVKRLQSPDLKNTIQEKEELSSTIKQVKEEKEILKEKVQSTSQFILQVKHQINRMTTERDEAQQISEDLRNAEENCKKELDRMNEELVNAQSSQSATRARLTEVEEEVEKLRRVQDGEEDDKKTRMEVQRKINVMKSEMSVLKFAGDRAKKETQSVNDEIQKLKFLLNEKNELQKEREKLQELLKQTNAKRNELHSMEVDNANKLVERDVNIQNLREEIDVAYKKNSTYEADKAPMISQMVEENHLLQKRILDLEYFIQKSSFMSMTISIKTNEISDERSKILSASSDERVQMLNKEVARLRSRHKYLTDVFQNVKKDPKKAAEFLKSLEDATKVDENDADTRKGEVKPVYRTTATHSPVETTAVLRRPASNVKTSRARPLSMIETSNTTPVASARTGRTTSRVDDSTASDRTRTRSTTPSGRASTATPQVTTRIKSNQTNIAANRISAPPSTSRSSTSLSGAGISRVSNVPTPRAPNPKTITTPAKPAPTTSGAQVRRSATTAGTARPAPGTAQSGRPSVISRTSSSSSITSTRPVSAAASRIQPASGATTQQNRMKPATSTSTAPAPAVTLRNRTSNVAKPRPTSMIVSSSTSRINRTPGPQTNAPPQSATPRGTVRPVSTISTRNSAITTPNKITRVNSQPTVRNPASNTSLQSSNLPGTKSRPGNRQSQPISTSNSQLRRSSTVSSAAAARVSRRNDEQSSSASNLAGSSSNHNLNDVIPSNKLRAQHQSFETTSSAVDLPKSSNKTVTSNRPIRRPAPGTHKSATAASTSALAIRRSNPVPPVSLTGDRSSRNSNLMPINRRPLTGNSTSQLPSASQRRDSLDNKTFFCDNCHKFGHSSDECVESGLTSNTPARSNSGRSTGRPGLSSSTMRLLSEHKKSTS